VTTPPPPPKPDVAKVTLRGIERRLKSVERALRKSAGTLRMRVEQLINAKVSGAVNHQVFTFMDGDWVPRGGNWIEWTGSDTGTGTLEVDGDLIDPSEWPDDQVWLATASVKLTGSFFQVYETGTIPLNLGVGPVTITLDDPADPSTLLTFDSDTLTVDFPMDIFERPVDPPSLSIGFTDGATPLAGSKVNASEQFLTSAAWLHEPGATPHIHAELIADATTYPSGGTIDVTVHLYPLA